MRLFIAATPLEVGEYTAEYVTRRITEFAPTAERKFVLGLPTGEEPFDELQQQKDGSWVVSLLCALYA
jgi:6-phosphogluconolactonase/glucosamine-6-phosphate isomerase/deaminase